MQLVGCYKIILILPFPSYRFLQVRAFGGVCPPDPPEIDGLALQNIYAIGAK